MKIIQEDKTRSV